MAKKPVDPTLFDTVAKRGTNKIQAPILALSSNWSIGSFLARGVLLAPVLEEKSGNIFIDDQNHLPLFADGIPEEWVKGVENGARNSFPIAIRLRSGSMEPSERQGKIGFSFAEVESIVFQNTDEVDRFKSNKMLEYDLDKWGLNFDIDDSLFCSGNSLEDTASPLFDLKSPPSQALIHADGLAGVLAVFPHVSPCTEKWVLAWEEAWNAALNLKSRESGWMKAILVGLDPAQAIDGFNVEETVLAVLVRTAAHKFGSDVGWPTDEVLTEIISETRKVMGKGLSAEDSDRLLVWENKCREVLNVVSTPPEFLDEKSIPFRAAMLFILRKDVESIARTRDDSSSLPIGKQVRCLAALMAASRMGLRRLPAQFKIPPGGDIAKKWLGSLGSRIIEDLVQPEDKSSTAFVKLKNEYRSLGTLQGEWVIRRGPTELFRITRFFEPDLLRIHAIGTSLGYEMEEYGELGLKTRFSWKSGRAQTVFLELVRRSSKDQAVLRFWSPALNLAPARKSKKSPWPATKLKRGLGLNGLVDLLERNAKTSMNCRFAVDREKELLVVIVDQLLATMDEQEFSKHVEHVAKTADDFERDQGLDEFI